MSSLVFCDSVKITANQLLPVVGALSNDLNTLIVAASLAYAVCSVVLAALGAFYDVSGVLKLPNA